MNSGPKRFLGLALSGAKNPKTALATIEYYPTERKVFLLDLGERLPETDSNPGPDATLLEWIHEKWLPETQMGINVPMDLPPCIGCTRKICPMPAKCSVTEVKWMRDRWLRSGLPAGELTPYTHRAVDLYLKLEAVDLLPKSYRFEIDETLGSNRAPLASRINFLLRHLPIESIHEVHPKLSLAAIALENQFDARVTKRYRDLEDGIHSREVIIDSFTKQLGVFIYEGDMKTLSQNLAAFDAFIAAYTVLLDFLGHSAPRPRGFPKALKWIVHPNIPAGASEQDEST